MIVDVFVKHSETCSADINLEEVMIPCVLQQLVLRLDHMRGCKLGMIRHVIWIRLSHERGKFNQQVHCWIHGQSHPSVNEAVGAIKLLKRLGYMLLV
jgi:hypothetical protein